MDILSKFYYRFYSNGGKWVSPLLATKLIGGGLFFGLLYSIVDNHNYFLYILTLTHIVLAVGGYFLAEKFNKSKFEVIVAMIAPLGLISAIVNYFKPQDYEDSEQI